MIIPGCAEVSSDVLRRVEPSVVFVAEEFAPVVLEIAAQLSSTWHQSRTFNPSP